MDNGSGIGWFDSTSTATVITSSIHSTVSMKLEVALPLEENCTKWTTTRGFIQIYLAIILLVNIFSTYVMATTKRRKGSPFITSCMGIINLFHIVLTLYLFLYPFAFSWSENEVTNENFNKTAILMNGTNRQSSKSEREKQSIHSCDQSDNVACRLSGIIFGIALYIPLITTVLMTIDTAMATFFWKIYRFQSERTSSLRLALFSIFSLVIIASFVIPAFAVEIQYHYEKLFKVCWLSVYYVDSENPRFVYFIFGLTTFITVLISLTVYLVIRARQAERIPYKREYGHHCTLIFGQFQIMKSKSWISYTTTVVWSGILAIVTYMPLTAGYMLKFHLADNIDLYWFSLMTEIVILILPSTGSLLYIGLYKPHRERAIEVIRGCSPNATNNKVSPVHLPSNNVAYAFLASRRKKSWNDNVSSISEGLYDTIKSQRDPKASAIRSIGEGKEVNGIDRVRRSNRIYYDDSGYNSPMRIRASENAYGGFRYPTAFHSPETRYSSSPTIFASHKNTNKKGSYDHLPTIPKKPSFSKLVWRYARNIVTPFSPPIDDKHENNYSRRYNHLSRFQHRFPNSFDKTNTSFTSDTEENLNEDRDYPEAQQFAGAFYRHTYNDRNSDISQVSAKRFLKKQTCVSSRQYFASSQQSLCREQSGSTQRNYFPNSHNSAEMQLPLSNAFGRPSRDRLYPSGRFVNPSDYYPAESVRNQAFKRSPRRYHREERWAAGRWQ